MNSQIEYVSGSRLPLEVVEEASQLRLILARYLRLVALRMAKSRSREEPISGKELREAVPVVCKQKIDEIRSVLSLSETERELEGSSVYVDDVDIICAFKNYIVESATRDVAICRDESKTLRSFLDCVQRRLDSFDMEQLDSIVARHLEVVG